MNYGDLGRKTGALAAIVGVLAFIAGLAASDAMGAGGSGGLGPETLSSSSESGVFPVQGKHSYGDGLGAGRGHQGQDIMAKCGKPVVAAQPGRVEYRDYQASGAGNYVVIDGKRKLHDTVYMHLSKPAKVREGARVSAGELLGKVGTTGRSTACHLHFEMWSRGWSSGKPIDPKPYLKRWDRSS